MSQATDLWTDVLRSDTMRDEIQIKIRQSLADKLIFLGISPESIESGNIRLGTLFYQIYWYHRLKNNPEEQGSIYQHFLNYLFFQHPNKPSLSQLDIIFGDSVLANNAKYYVESYIKPIRTVDLVITRSESEENNSPNILCLKRDYYPVGLALPGGFVLDTDEDNPYLMRKELYAALRTISTKIFQNKQLAIQITTNTRGKTVYFVQDEQSNAKINIEPLDEKGFVYRDNIKYILKPSDPRHIVDTIAFKCILEGGFELKPMMQWCAKSSLLQAVDENKLVFNHHVELINQITAQTDLDKELTYQETGFIRGIIDSPLDAYDDFCLRFKNNNDSTSTSMPELFPVVSQLLHKMYDSEINQICSQNTTLLGLRDKATISLRHVSLKNRVFCPYLPTLRAIFEAVAFFDIVAREKRSFYANISKDAIHEHNPSTLPYASYHMYRYKYRMDDLLGCIPNEIIIPTFESFSATDLMKVRCVPIRFVGLATDFIYVDEFEQSPEEFLMHDINHNWRMMNEDRNTMHALGISQSQMRKESFEFSQKCLHDLKFHITDTPQELEFKKIKLIILFEIVHEDARPFLRSLINEYIQFKEGQSVPFEVPRIDPVTNYMDMVDTLDTGISTLSYVRNKLQYGFYDQVDKQSPDLVEPSYRTAENIAKAAYQMLVDYEATPNPLADIDEQNHTSYEWLLKRVCAAGPDNIHNTEFIDPSVKIYGDGTEKLNPKRYQSGNIN